MSLDIVQQDVYHSLPLLQTISLEVRMRKVSELYKMYRELPVFQVYFKLNPFWCTLNFPLQISVSNVGSETQLQTLFDALEELCDEDNPGGESPTLPLHLAPAVVHTFDRVSEQWTWHWMWHKLWSDSRGVCITVQCTLCFCFVLIIWNRWWWREFSPLRGSTL